MVSPAVAGASTNSPATPAGGGVVPFFFGSNFYAQKFGSVDATQLDSETHEFTYNIIPGGFLRGVRLQLRSTGGVGGTATADNPWNVLHSLKLQNVDGSEMVKSMDGYAHYLGQRFFRPWHGDPAKRNDYAAGANPSCSLFVQPEVRHGYGVLANTDARAQFQINYMLNTATNVITSGTTAPTVSITKYAEIWAQPDSADLHGNPIEPIPPGLNLETIRRHQMATLNNAGADNIIQLNLTGNELRGLILVVRDSNNARQDYLSDPIRWSIDNRNLGVFSPTEVFDHMQDFYQDLASGASTRPTGVYVWPRFYQPGRMVGQSWLGTTNATYLTWETATLSSGSNLPGTIQIISDEMIARGPLPAEADAI